MTHRRDTVKIMEQNLDYNDPDAAVNFRDVGEFINMIGGQTILPEKRLYRVGTVMAIFKPEVIGNPKTIFCLKKGPEHDFTDIRNVHFPISNLYEKYQTELPEVRAWLKTIIRTIEDGIEFPLYIHCLSGRDRTGVVVAALLKICGAEDRDIIEEYKFSLGVEKRNHIHLTLQGFGDIDTYFKGIDITKVRSILQGT